MRGWLILLGGMLVWTVHFFALYALASLFGTTALARILTGLFTLAGIGANLMLLAACVRLARRSVPEGVLDWPARVGGLGAGLSLVAVAWQGLPALLI